MDWDCSCRGTSELRVSWIADVATGLGELPAPDGLSTAIIANSYEMYSVQMARRRCSLLLLDASVVCLRCYRLVEKEIVVVVEENLRVAEREGGEE